MQPPKKDSAAILGEGQNRRGIARRCPDQQEDPRPSRRPCRINGRLQIRFRADHTVVGALDYEAGAHSEFARLRTRRHGGENDALSAVGDGITLTQGRSDRRHRHALDRLADSRAILARLLSARILAAVQFRLRRAGARTDIQRLTLAVTQDFQPQRIARPCAGHATGQFGRAVDRITVHADDHVADLHPATFARGAGRHLGDIGALGVFAQPQSGRRILGQGLDLHAQIAALHAFAAHQLVSDRLGRGRGNGEADADRAARRREDRRVHADHAAIDVEGRSARVAPVDGGVDLQIFVVAGRIDVARLGRNDTGCRRAAKTERVADRQNPVADARRGGFFKADEREGVALDLDDRQISAFVATDQARLQLAPVAQLDLDLLGVLDDVVVGHDEAVGRDQEARTGAERRGRVVVLALARTAAARRAGDGHS
uniref:LigA n=1 Tax=Parastrongyloides trichosuri TaxID=131310 RepID=A0A0N4Z1E6_PARTI